MGIHTLNSNSYRVRISKAKKHPINIKIIESLGYIIFLASGAYLYINSLFFYQEVWGDLGLKFAVYIFPAAEFFPLVAWIVTGKFSWILFLVWIIGLSGLFLLIYLYKRKDFISK